MGQTNVFKTVQIKDKNGGFNNNFCYSIVPDELKHNELR